MQRKARSQTQVSAQTRPLCSREACEIEALAELSARLGRDPLLVQATSGNTSVKLDGVLWIKASGKWLADACDEGIFTCVDYSDGQVGAPFFFQAREQAN